jgi:hypothetical protein
MDLERRVVDLERAARKGCVRVFEAVLPDIWELHDGPVSAATERVRLALQERLVTGFVSALSGSVLASFRVCALQGNAC